MTCPPVKDVNDNLIDLNYEEKLELIRDESQSLYDFCVEKGFNSNQMRECLNCLTGKPIPLYERVIAGSRKSFMKLALLVAVISMVMCHRPILDVVQINLRIASLRVSQIKSSHVYSLMEYSLVNY